MGFKQNEIYQAIKKSRNWSSGSSRLSDYMFVNDYLLNIFFF